MDRPASTEGDRGNGVDAIGVAAPGYRLPASTRLGSVSLQVSSMERSLEFYQQVLGLRAISGGGGRVQLAPGSGGGVLIELVERPGAQPVPPRGRLGLFHVAYLLPGRAALGRFLAHVARLQVPVGMSDHLVSEAIYLSDPDGLGIEVYADRPRDTWRYRSREIAMSTDPLDATDLLEASGGEPWTGAPEGTVVGHVHLHVGDLAEAAAFYHEALGLDKVVWSYPGALFLSAGGYHHHLGINTWARGAASPGENDARLLEWTIRVPDEAEVDRAAASLQSRNYEVDLSEGGASFRARDPWGTVVRLRAA